MTNSEEVLNGVPKPNITKAEFKVIQSVFERLGCDSLINFSDYFSFFSAVSFRDFFANQPAAISALLKYTGGRSDEVNKFVDSLNRVNDTLQRISEACTVFDDVETMCSSLDEAYTCFYREEAKEKRISE